MNWEFFDILLILIGGFMAGSINAIAGFGSIITLSILMDFIGLAPNVANATNRVNVFFAATGTSISYHRNGKLRVKEHITLLSVVFVGALIGALLAAYIPGDQFKNIYRILLVFFLFYIVLKPKQLLEKQDQAPTLAKHWVYLFMFIAGIYAGFIQIGFGVFFLILILATSPLNMIQSNALKVFCVSIYTLFVLLIFQFQGLVNWEIGIMLAVGQTIGGVVTSHFASRYENIDRWAYRLLILVMVIALIKSFNLFNF